MVNLQSSPSIEQQTAAVRSGRQSAEALVAQCLQRCESNRDLGAITELDAHAALQHAHEIDRRAHAGEHVGMLAGAAYVTKDNIDIAGFATTAGHGGFRGNLPKANAVVVDQLRRSDAVMVGKTNMHELAMGGTTSNPSFGVCQNPRDRTRVPGGSSGGSAAAVAAGLTPFALASDTAGSARIPAAFCGVAGFRPATFSPQCKAYSDVGLLPCSKWLDTIGLIARSVCDLRYIDSILCSANIPSPALRPEEIKIGVPTSHFCDHLDPPVAHAYQRALERLSDAGFELLAADMTPLLEKAEEAFLTLLAAGIVQDFRAFCEESPTLPDFDSIVAGIKAADVKAIFSHTLSKPPSESDISAAIKSRSEIQTRFSSFMRTQGFACLCWPTSPLSPPRIQPRGDVADPRIVINGQEFSQIWMMIRNTSFGSLIGAPCVSLPISESPLDLPVGLDLISSADSETSVLAIAEKIELCLSS